MPPLSSPQPSSKYIAFLRTNRSDFFVLWDLFFPQPPTSSPPLELRISGACCFFVIHLFFFLLYCRKIDMSSSEVRPEAEAIVSDPEVEESEQESEEDRDPEQIGRAHV